jgi:pyruvate/2-oxoglutarate dehydrogenase complex dihydrolipoamide acyltransferase (E2) component
MAVRQIGDWLDLAARRHMMHGLLELDVTEARLAIREERRRTGEPLSFTAFLVACLARAIDEDKVMHGHRKGRDKLILYDDVDVAVAVERTVDGARVPVPYVIRAANRKSASQISREINDAAAKDVPYAFARRMLPLWLIVPRLIRRVVWSRYLADSHRRKRLTGTTFVSSVGGFGRGTAFGIPQAQNYTLGMTVAGIVRKPGLVGRSGEERIEAREFVSLTLSIDHDIVEGAPAARFTSRLKKLIEGASVLGESARGASDGP